jgi:hypothetical protein
MLSDKVKELLSTIANICTLFVAGVWYRREMGCQGNP